MSTYPFGAMLPSLHSEVPGPESRRFSSRLSQLESPSLAQRRTSREKLSGESFSPIVYKRGHGSNIEDVDKNIFVDLACGFGSLSLGHTPKKLLELVQNQEDELTLALGDLYPSDAKVLAAEKVISVFTTAFPDAVDPRLFFGLSGSDAVTAAIKSVQIATKKNHIIAFSGAYHGLSHGPLALCGYLPLFRQPFFPLLSDSPPSVYFAPYPGELSDDGHRFTETRRNELAAQSLNLVEDELKKGKTAAIFVEPMLGRGGVLSPPDHFFYDLRALCTKYDAFLVCDEILTGLGRTGTMFASQKAKPDLICLGKALGAGYPISVCIGRKEIMKHWGSLGGAYIHTATHFASPPACRALIFSLTTMEDKKLAGRAEKIGEKLAKLLTENKFVVSGKGLLLGIHFKDAHQALRVSRRLLERGYIVSTGGIKGNVITLTPALTIYQHQLVHFTTELLEATK